MKCHDLHFIKQDFVLHVTGGCVLLPFCTSFVLKEVTPDWRFVTFIGSLAQA